jgi:hypothetical protein
MCACRLSVHRAVLLRPSYSTQICSRPLFGSGYDEGGNPMATKGRKTATKAAKKSGAKKSRGKAMKATSSSTKKSSAKKRAAKKA